MILYYILVPFAWLLWHIGFRIHVEGRENLKKVQTKGCILAPTHVSAIDPVFIVVTRWSRRMIVFAKKELFEINALLTWFFRCCGAVCVRGTKDEMAAIEQTVETRQCLNIACLEEIAWRKGYISSDDVRRLAKPMAKNEYGQYLYHLVTTGEE